MSQPDQKPAVQNMKTVQEIITTHGGLPALDRNYLRIENAPYMRLVLEVISPFYPDGSCQVSVAHYGEQNGDAMRDPEITFLVNPKPEGWEWHPLSFTNDYLGYFSECAEVRQGRHQILSQREFAGVKSFSKQWDSNIRHQGFLEAFRTSKVSA